MKPFKSWHYSIHANAGRPTPPHEIEGSCAKSQPEVVRIIVRKFTLLCTGIEPVVC